MLTQKNIKKKLKSVKQNKIKNQEVRYAFPQKDGHNVTSCHETFGTRLRNTFHHLNTKTNLPSTQTLEPLARN